MIWAERSPFLLFAIENARPPLCISQSQYEKLSAWEF